MIRSEPLQALIGATILRDDALVGDMAVLIEGDMIAGVIPHADDLPATATRVDTGGGILAPGFIDLQVNGGGGVLFNDDPCPATVGRIGSAHRRFGTTGFLPTLISDSRERRRAAASAVIEARGCGMPGVLGIHWEGPHLNPERRGVHQARWLGPPDRDDLEIITRAHERHQGASLVTLAPEVAGIETIQALAPQGIRVAAGHTMARHGTMQAAVAAGLSGVTHLYNAMPSPAARDPGPVGVSLDESRLWCGIIADGHHVHDAMLRLAWRAKGAERLVLVTDAMPPVGTSADRFDLQGEPIFVADGRCTTADGRLAGSALDMASAVRHCVRLGIPVTQALRMASATPAAFLGLQTRYGRLAAGYAADLVLLDDALAVRETWVSGQPSTV